MLTPSLRDSPDPVQVWGRVDDNLDLARSLQLLGLEAEVKGENLALRDNLADALLLCHEGKLQL